MKKRFYIIIFLSLILISRLWGQQYSFQAPKIIQWYEASNYYGEYVTVVGTIVSTYNSGRACFLNFHPDYKHYLTAVIFRSAFNRFPKNPEIYYYGKNVKITGVIKEYRGKPEIIVNYPQQIEIIEEQEE